MLDGIFDILGDFFLIKFGLLILTGMYILFLLVVLKQTRAMSGVIKYTSVSTTITAVALFNVIFGILLFVAALVIL